MRLADFDAPELDDLGGQCAKALLQRVACGRQLVCRATPGRSGRVVVYDRVIAACTLGGRRLGEVLRAAGGTARAAGSTRPFTCGALRGRLCENPPRLSCGRVPLRQHVADVGGASRIAEHR